MRRITAVLQIALTVGGLAAIEVHAGEPCDEQLVVESEGDEEARFGQTIAMSGNRAVVGAPSHDLVVGRDMGAAYVYRLVEKQWMIEQRLLAPDAKLADRGAYFGTSVDIDDDVIVVGAPGDWVGHAELEGEPTGGAYVFRTDGGAWFVEQKLLPADAVAGAQVGRCVAVRGDTIIVGAEGALYVFEHDGSRWTEAQKIVASDDPTALGVNVAIDGDHLFAGAPEATPARVYAYRRTDGQWGSEQSLRPLDDGCGNCGFGTGISISGTQAVIGRPNDSPYGFQEGSIYIFEFNGSAWVQDQKIAAFDPASGADFGGSVAMDDNAMIVGAPYDLTTGAIYLYRIAIGVGIWTQVAPKYRPADAERDDRFGACVVLVDRRGIVGASLDDNVNGDDAGSVFFYDCLSGD